VGVALYEKVSWFSHRSWLLFWVGSLAVILVAVKIVTNHSWVVWLPLNSSENEFVSWLHMFRVSGKVKCTFWPLCFALKEVFRVCLTEVKFIIVVFAWKHGKHPQE